MRPGGGKAGLALRPPPSPGPPSRGPGPWRTTRRGDAIAGASSPSAAPRRGGGPHGRHLPRSMETPLRMDGRRRAVRRSSVILRGQPVSPPRRTPDPPSPADVPARPPSPRATSPGGRSPRTCTSSGPMTGTPLRTDGRRRAARQSSVILRGRPVSPSRAHPTRAPPRTCPPGRARRVLPPPADDPRGPAPHPG